MASSATPIPIAPMDLELERAVLGGALLDAGTARVVASAPVECFHLEKHRALYRALGRIAPSLNGHPPDAALLRSIAAEAGDAIDPVLLAEAQEAGLLVVAPERYLAQLRELAARREEFAVTAMLHAAYDRGLTAGAHDPTLWRTVEDRLARAKTLRQPVTLEVTDIIPLGEGLGSFLGKEFPEAVPLVEGILSADGNGWIAGEEKLGKSWYALAEGLDLALGAPVAGRFPVPQSRRVVFIGEEDPPRRGLLRVRALLRGRGLDPDDASVRALLDEWFRIEIWSGFSLDDAAWLARLDATCDRFRPAVVYLDVLRKMTAKDLNKADQASALLAPLDALRRRYGVVFRVLHHYRKSQGFRTGRGSQEIGGSFVLGAWGECSLFFEPVGRKQGAVRVEVQVKDGAPVPAFRLKLHAEGPSHAPTLVRLTVEDEAESSSADDVLLQALATAPTVEALVGKPGVPIATLATLLKRSDKTIRRALKRLQDAHLVSVTGQASKQVALYAVNS
jgi:hypothetical protein